MDEIDGTLKVKVEIEIEHSSCCSKFFKWLQSLTEDRKDST